MPPAVVIGLCAHGLATVRCLAEAGVSVHAIEANADLPGFSTRLARVHQVPGIHGPDLIEALLGLTKEFPAGTRPVLFPINDKMVECIARNWPELALFYQLSWADCRDDVLRLLNKSSLSQHCTERELFYPQSLILESADGLEQRLAGARFPLIVKPTRPLGSFKTSLAHTIDDVSAIVTQYASDLPLVSQPWIDGDDSQLYFCALYLDRGRVLARFDGHKLRSSPRTMGHTTIAESVTDDDLFKVTQKFFAGLNMTGPVSLEIKKDPESRMWIIEPTVGRTDYWLPVCIQNGIPLPHIEYCQVTGKDCRVMDQKQAVRWFDTQRDPFCYLSFLMTDGRRLKRQRATFPFLDRSDFRPFARGLWQTTQRLARSLRNRVTRWTPGTVPEPR